jgi:hypothetical protein
VKDLLGFIFLVTLLFFSLNVFPLLLLFFYDRSFLVEMLKGFGNVQKISISSFIVIIIFNNAAKVPIRKLLTYCHQVKLPFFFVLEATNRAGHVLPLNFLLNFEFLSDFFLISRIDVGKLEDNLFG